MMDVCLSWWMWDRDLPPRNFQTHKYMSGEKYHVPYQFHVDVVVVVVAVAVVVVVASDFTVYKDQFPIL